MYLPVWCPCCSISPAAHSKVCAGRPWRRGFALRLVLPMHIQKVATGAIAPLHPDGVSRGPRREGRWYKCPHVIQRLGALWRQWHAAYVMVHGRNLCNDYKTFRHAPSRRLPCRGHHCGHTPPPVRVFACSSNSGACQLQLMCSHSDCRRGAAQQRVTRLNRLLKPYKAQRPQCMAEHQHNLPVIK